MSIIGGSGDPITGVPAGFKGGERDQFLTHLDGITQDSIAPRPVAYGPGGSSAQPAQAEDTNIYLPAKAPAGFKGGEAKQFTHPNEDNNKK
jgi:hypothetical protein